MRVARPTEFNTIRPRSGRIPLELTTTGPRQRPRFVFVVVFVGFVAVGVDVVTDVVVVLASVQPSVAYAFGATKGILQSQDPLETPGVRPR